MNPDRLKCQLPSTLVTTHAGMESQLSACLCLAVVSLPPSASDSAPPARPACLASFSRALGSCLL